MVGLDRVFPSQRQDAKVGGSMSRKSKTTVFALTLWAALILASTATRGEPVNGASDAAKRDANAMNQAFVKGDFETFAKYAYPGVLKKMGGKRKLIATLQQGLADM